MVGFWTSLQLSFMSSSPVEETKIKGPDPEVQASLISESPRDGGSNPDFVVHLLCNHSDAISLSEFFPSLPRRGWCPARPSSTSLVVMDKPAVSPLMFLRPVGGLPPPCPHKMLTRGSVSFSPFPPPRVLLTSSFPVLSTEF